MAITKINSLGITNPVSFSAGTVGSPSITFSGDTNTGVFAPAADTIAFTEGGAEAMRINSSGNVGINNSSPSTKLVVSDNNAEAKVTIQQTGDIISDMISFTRNGSERGKILVNDSQTVYQTSSDYRLKKNITPLTNALETVAKLKPSKFTWVQERGGKEDNGFIAHELQEVLPSAVTGKKDEVDAKGKPIYQGIDTSFLVATLTAAIQELIAIKDTQTNIIEELKARLTTLESK